LAPITVRYSGIVLLLRELSIAMSESQKPTFEEIELILEAICEKAYYNPECDPEWLYYQRAVLLKKIKAYGGK